MDDDVEWRECDDPEVLAAAVAAGVRVEGNHHNGVLWWLTDARSADDFAEYIKEGNRFRIPAWWSPGWTPLPAPPDGCEWVALPTATVDRWGEGLAGISCEYHVLRDVVSACREAQARRPKPEPRTERVPWWEAVGRRFPDGAVIGRVESSREAGAFAFEEGSDYSGMYVDADGKVEVLVEDGDR